MNNFENPSQNTGDIPEREILPEEAYEWRQTEEASKEGDIMFQEDLLERVVNILKQEGRTFEVLLGAKATEHAMAEYIVRFDNLDESQQVFEMLRGQGLNVERMASVVKLEE